MILTIISLILYQVNMNYMIIISYYHITLIGIYSFTLVVGRSSITTINYYLNR